MRIVIVNLTRIGDQLQTSPTIIGLKDRYPHAEITLVGDAHHMEVAHGIPGVDRVYDLDLNRIGRDLLRGHIGLVDAYRYVEHVVHELREPGFDLAFNFSSSRMSSVLMRLLRVPDCRGWMMDSEGNRLILNPWSRLFVASVLNRPYTPYNLVDFYCRVAGVRPREKRLWYTPTREAGEQAQSFLESSGVPSGTRVIALQPGASNAIRQWPPESFAVLGRHLRERLGAWILLLGGPNEGPLCDRIASEIGPRAISAAGKTDLAMLAGLLSRTALLITGDTGPMHLAVAVGTPVVAFFFGPAYVWETGPYAADSIAFQTRIACSPCHHAVKCLSPVCREELTPDMIFWAAHDRLAQDYEALAQRARCWSSVDLYRIAFDDAGMYDPLPLVPRLDVAEALRLVYREMWRAALDGIDDDARARKGLSSRWQARGGATAVLDFGGPRRALEQLCDLSHQGQRLAETLLAEACQPQPSVERVATLGEEIENIDAAIERQGHVETAVGSLARMFGFAKENVSETQALHVLSRETVKLYQALDRWATLSLGLLDVIDRPHVRALDWGGRLERPWTDSWQADRGRSVPAAHAAGRFV